MSDDYVVSETYPGYCYHLRRVGSRPVKYGGHTSPRPRALCGRDVAWDTRSPVKWFIDGRANPHERRCDACREIGRKELAP